MEAHPFATVIGTDGNQAVATQLPLLIYKDGENLKLRGHMMRQTDHHQAFEKNKAALILFHGPQSYVSAGWYSERGHGSTWNYMTVHVRGHLRFLDVTGTIEILSETTRLMEKDQQTPQHFEQLTPDYIAANVKAIVGFEIKVDWLYPIFKLSQNRDVESYRNIVYQLLASTDPQAHAVAKEMMALKPELFLE